MLLELKRIVLTPNSTCGMLYVDGELECWTLEEPFKDGLGNPGSCIKAGTYSIVISPSPKFESSKDSWEVGEGKNIPHLQAVPNREYILIHWGNSVKDTEGCILVGQTHQPDYIGQSRLAFVDLMDKLLGQTDLSITIEDAG